MHLTYAAQYASKNELERSLGFPIQYDDEDDDEDDGASSMDESCPSAVAARYSTPLNPTSPSSSDCADDEEEDDECGISTGPSHRFHGKSSGPL